MFIIIPLLLLILSLAGIVFIVARKLAYLQKLTPESHTFGSNLWEDFFPELMTTIRGIKIREYKDKALFEVEKFLRKIRLLILTVERLSDALIRSLRRVHQRGQLQKEEAAAVPLEVTPVTPIEVPSISNVRTRNGRTTVLPEVLKQEEQRLIVAIAQNPKDPSLYKSLGDVYMKLKNYADARDSFQAALKLEPDDAVISKKLTTALDKIAKTGDN